MSHVHDFLPVIPYVKFLNLFLKYQGMVELRNSLGQYLSLNCYNNKCKYRPINLKIKKMLMCLEPYFG